jgi:hypothetical protein
VTAVERVWPPPDRRERIEGRWEGGWIATGRCGRPHLVGGNWNVRCPVCVRIQSATRINERQAATLAVFYSDPDPEATAVVCQFCDRPAPTVRSNQVHMWRAHHDLAKAAQ